jgi:putative membrane protein
MENAGNMSKPDQPQLPTIDSHTETMETSKDLRVVAALVRTVFSSEQTLMSWMRTSVSLFTFGFALSQFFQFLGEQHVGESAAGPRRLAIVLISVGVLTLGAAMAEHVYRLRTLEQQGLQQMKRYLLPLGSATVLLIIGCAALVVVIFKL